MNKRIRWKKIKQRGNLLGRNIDCTARPAGNVYAFNDDGSLSEKVVGTMPNTYYFIGHPYTSYSALIPIGDKRNPFEYTRMIYDEDENCVDGWESVYIDNPFDWQTEEDFLMEEKIKYSKQEEN